MHSKRENVGPSDTRAGRYSGNRVLFLNPNLSLCKNQGVLMPHGSLDICLLRPLWSPCLWVQASLETYVEDLELYQQSPTFWLLQGLTFRCRYSINKIIDCLHIDSWLNEKWFLLCPCIFIHTEIGEQVVAALGRMRQWITGSGAILC